MYSIKEILGNDTAKQVVERIRERARQDLFSANPHNEQARRQITIDELIQETK